MGHFNLMSQVQQRGATWSWDKFIFHLTLKSFVEGVLMDVYTEQKPFAITYFSDDTDSGKLLKWTSALNLHSWSLKTSPLFVPVDVSSVITT